MQEIKDKYTFDIGKTLEGLNNALTDSQQVFKKCFERSIQFC